MDNTAPIKMAVPGPMTVVDSTFDEYYHELMPALTAHASQFTVDGRDAIHSGGQREPLQLRTGVRRRA